jgi:hypothetical protein
VQDEEHETRAAEQKQRNLQLYKSLFLEALLDDGVVTEQEEGPLADFARVVGLSDVAVQELRESLSSQPEVAARVAELLKGAREAADPPEGFPDEDDAPSFADPDGPGWESDVFAALPGPRSAEEDKELSGRLSRMRVLRAIAKESGSCLSEVGTSLRSATCNVEDPQVQERLRQAAAGVIELEFAPLTTGPGGLAAVWPEAGRNLLREVKAVAGWRLAFAAKYVTPDRLLETVRHKRGWLYFRSGRRQGIYVRFGSKRGSQVSVFVGYCSEHEDADSDFESAREAILSSCDSTLGRGWSLEQPERRLALEAKRTLSCEEMTDPGVVLSVADALERLSTYVVEHQRGCTPRGDPSLG